MRATDWMPMHIGDYVCRQDDDIARHPGRVNWIYWSSSVNVTWLHSGIKETLDIQQLRRMTAVEIREEELCTPPRPQLLPVRNEPKMHAVSPRRKLEDYFRGEE